MLHLYELVPVNFSKESLDAISWTGKKTCYLILIVEVSNSHEKVVTMVILSKNAMFLHTHVWILVSRSHMFHSTGEELGES